LFSHSQYALENALENLCGSPAAAAKGFPGGCPLIAAKRQKSKENKAKKTLTERIVVASFT
jgi:hypothetical protein